MVVNSARVSPYLAACRAAREAYYTAIDDAITTYSAAVVLGTPGALDAYNLARDTAIATYNAVVAAAEDAAGVVSDARTEG